MENMPIIWSWTFLCVSDMMWCFLTVDGLPAVLECLLCHHHYSPNPIIKTRKRQCSPLGSFFGRASERGCWAHIPTCVCCVHSFPAPAGCLSHTRSCWTAATVMGRWITWATTRPRTETSQTGWWCSWRWPRRGAPHRGKARGAATWAWRLTLMPLINTPESFFQLHTSYSI